MSELVQKLLESIFRDNGIGFPASMDGPMMVDLSVFTQSGHIDIECADGTTFSLKPSLCLLCHELWRQYLKVKPVNGVTKVRLPYVETAWHLEPIAKWIDGHMNLKLDDLEGNKEKTREAVREMIRATKRHESDPNSIFLYDFELEIFKEYRSIVGGPLWVLTKRLEIPLMEMAIKSFMFRVHMGWDAVHAEEYLKWGQQQRILALQSLMAKGNAADIQMYHMYMSMFIREIRYVPGDVERLHPLLLVPNTAVLKNFFHVGGADLAVKNVKRPHEVAFPPRSMLEEDPSPDPTVPLKVRVKENGKLDY